MTYIELCKWVEIFQPAIIAFLGALVGGLFAIYGVNVTHDNNLKEHEIKEEK